MNGSWIANAVLSAVFAGATAVIAKLGLTSVNADLATLVRTAFVLIFLIALYAFLHGTPKVSTVPRDALLFLALSALTTALSWLFYYRAVQFGPVAAVSAIDKGSLIVTAVLAALFLGETFNLRVLGGAALVSVGLWLMVSARNI